MMPGDREQCLVGAEKVLVLHHPHDGFHKMPYVVHLFMDAWRQRGLAVDVACDTRHKVDDRTVVVPHLDLTRTPDDFARFLADCPRVVNRGVTDISKRRVSRQLVTSPQDCDGPVLVKTDRNAGGEPERRIQKKSGLRGKLTLALQRRLPWTRSGIVGPYEYRVYDHPRDVPSAVWRQQKLVVEKFLPETRGDLYCLRQYLFFGSRQLNALLMGPEPIVKAINVARREMLEDIPEELVTLRREMGFDFGKFDYVLRDGKVVLFDVARTPTYNRASHAGSPSQILLSLAEGIDAFL